VKVVANGGGYGYGIMGATHHNIEDIGSMRLLPNMKVFVPFTKEDVFQSLETMMSDASPNYLRLNLASNQENLPAFSQWRKIKPTTNTPKVIIISTGTVTDNLFKLPPHLLNEIEVWLLSRYPVNSIPDELIYKIATVKNVVTMEEHRGQCGMHETLASLLLKKLSTPIQYNTLFASGYPSGRYGSQQWHQEENNMAGKALEIKIEEFLRSTYAVQ
jgi:transketolase